MQAPAWLVLVLTGLLIWSPVSTKVAGLVLLVLLLWGLWLRWRVPVVSVVDPLLVQWLWIALGVFTLRGAATLLWQDSWGSRHFELRLVLSALALWLIVPRMALKSQHKDWLTHGLALACWAALGVTWLYGRETPTNPIPWAAGVSFLVCVLLGRGLQDSRPVRYVWLLSALAGLGGVLLSQSRGSLGLVPWAISLVGALAWQSVVRHGARWRAVGGLGAGAALLALVLIAQPRLYQGPVVRMQEAAREVAALVQAIESNSVTPKVIDNSAGVRLYLYLRGWAEIQQAPWAGHGERARKVWMKDLGRESGSEVVLSLDHLHSDPLSIWFDHGLLGLGSYVLSILGLLLLAWSATEWGMRLGFAGLAWMHASTGLTNLNTIHNYYGVMLTLGVILVFLLSSTCSRSRAA